MADNDVFARDRLIRASDLTMLEIFYLVTLNQFLGDNDHAWPSQARIAESMNAGLSSVKKWQRELQKKEIIEIDSGAGCSSQNHYKINFAKLVTRPRKASKSNGLPQRPLQAEWST